jgi:hypothetical protein
LQAAKVKNATFFAPSTSLAAIIGMTGTATSGQLNAIFAKYPAGEFHGRKTAAALAGGFLVWIGGFGLHF